MKLNKVFKTLATGLVLALLCIPLFINPVAADEFLPGYTKVTLPDSTVARGTAVTWNINSSFAGVKYSFFLLTEAQISAGAQGSYIGEAKVTASKLQIVYQTGPKQALGKYYIKAIHAMGDSTSAADYYTEFTLADVSPDPTVTLEGPSNVKVGDTIRIKGAYFPSNALTQIKLNNAVVATATTASFQIDIAIGEMGYGYHHVEIINESVSFTKQLDIFVESDVTMFPTSGNPETLCVATGTGFATKTEVTFMININKIGSVTTDDNGSFVYDELKIPKLGAGSYTIVVSDRKSGSHELKFEVKQLPTSVSLSPTMYDYSTEGVVSASGLNGTAGFVRMSYSHTTIPGYGRGVDTIANGDENGYATGIFTFGKNMPAGVYKVELETGTNKVTKSYNVTLRPTIVVNKQSVMVGEEFTIEGWNFVPGSRVKIYLDQVLVTENVTVGTDCTFFVTPKMISAATGVHSLTVVDDRNNISASASISIGAQGSLTVTTPENRAYVGAKLNTSGNGFLPNATITVLALDVTDVDSSKAVTLASFLTDASGAFSYQFTITSALRGGDKNVTISDGTNTIEAKLYMDNTAPDAPVLAAPTNSVRVRDKEQPITFGWNGVYDPSGVTYEFQLTLDLGFKDILIQKSTAEQSVTLSEADKITVDGKAYDGTKLPAAASKAPYYWRVRAVDSIGNAGEWSDPFSFTTGFSMPNWIIWVYFGVGIVIVLILGVMVGRKLAYRNY